MKKYLSVLLNSILAGFLISIGGAVYLACANKYVGAVLFCVALTSICYKGYYLFTGKVGYLADSHKGEDFLNLAIGIIGNAIGTILIGEMLRFAMPNLQEVAYNSCIAKLDNTFWVWLAKGIMCGMLMYIAVSIYKEHNKNVVGIMLCIPAFILSGFEHSIADMFYMATSGIATGEAVGFLMTIILGNAIGAILLAVLTNTSKNLIKKE